MTNESSHSATQSLAQLLAGLLDLVDPISDAVLGYRNKLIEKGLGQAAADQCAADWHHWVISRTLPQGRTGQGGKS